MTNVLSCLNLGICRYHEYLRIRATLNVGPGHLSGSHQYRLMQDVQQVTGGTSEIKDISLYEEDTFTLNSKNNRFN